jgi:hypothetical protein
MSLHPAFADARGRRALLSPAQWLTVYALAMALIPPVYAVLSNGSRAPFDFLAADAFIYLAVAAKSQIGAYTFDGTHLTNGFHPLWQMALQAVFQLFGVAAKAQQIAVSFWLSVTLVAAGGILTTRAVFRWTGSAAAAMLAFPGLTGLAMLACGWPVGMPWHYMNGMESPVSLFFFGLTLFYLSRARALPLAAGAAVDRRQLLVLSVLSAGLVFGRLDDIFLPAVVVGWLALQRAVPFARRLEAVLWFGVPLGVMVLGYLAFNLATVGSAMPISGVSKFDYRTILINIGLLGSSLHALVPDFIYQAYHTKAEADWIHFVNWRNAQMLLPVIAARFLLGRMRWLDPGNDSALTAWMRPLLLYVIVKGLYNFLFVPLLHQGQWYYSLSFAIINIAAAVLVVQGWTRYAAPRLAPGILPLTAAGVAAAGVALFPRAGPDNAEAEAYADLVRRGPAIAEALRATDPMPRIVEADDGIVNYALGLPTMSGFLFAIDPAGYAAFKEGRFLTEAYRRGYRLIGSLYYLRTMSPDDLTPERIPETLSENLFDAASWDLDRFDFALAYRDAETGAVFIRFTPKR